MAEGSASWMRRDRTPSPVRRPIPPSIPIIHSLRPHSLLSSLLLSRNTAPTLLSSSSLNENDFSAGPWGVDLGQEPSSFRGTRGAALDVMRGLALCLFSLDVTSEYLGDWRQQNATWYDEVHFPLRPSPYLVQLVTSVSVPALHFLIGVGCVFNVATRKQLGKNTFQLFRRAIGRSLLLLALNELLVVQTVIRSRGKALLILLPLWSLAWNLLFVTFILLVLLLFERAIVHLSQRRLGALPTLAMPTERTPLAPPTVPPGPLSKAARVISFLSTYAIDLVLLAGVGGLLAMNLLSLPITTMEGPDQDWWIGGPRNVRSWGYWLFVAPTPTTWEKPYRGLVSLYAPLGWLPFSLCGAVYGRWLLRKERVTSLTVACTLLASIPLFLLFLLSRFLAPLNLATRHLHHPSIPSPAALPPGRSESSTLAGLQRGAGIYWASWQTLWWTTRYPPDAACFGLWGGATLVLAAVCLSVPGFVLKRMPLLQFGRAPIVFYVVQILGSHYLLPFVLSVLDWPRRLDLFWTLAVCGASLPVWWLVCEAYVVYKDRRPPGSWKRFL